MAFEVRFSKSARKQFGKLDNSVKIQILKRLQKISENPFLAKPLSGQYKNFFSERIGKLRIVFSVIGNDILISKIEHRKSVYRSLFT